MKAGRIFKNNLKILFVCVFIGLAGLAWFSVTRAPSQFERLKLYGPSAFFEGVTRVEIMACGSDGRDRIPNYPYILTGDGIGDLVKEDLLAIQTRFRLSDLGNLSFDIHCGSVDQKNPHTLFIFVNVNLADTPSPQTALVRLKVYKPGMEAQSLNGNAVTPGGIEWTFPLIPLNQSQGNTYNDVRALLDAKLKSILVLRLHPEIEDTDDADNLDGFS